MAVAGYSFTLVPAGIRTTYRTVRSLIHVCVLYSFILFYFWREIRQSICGIEKTSAIGKHWNSSYLLLLLRKYISIADPGGRAVYGVVLRPPRLLRLRVRIPPGHESYLFNFLCCQVEVSASGWSLVECSCRVWCVWVWSPGSVMADHYSESDQSVTLKKVYNYPSEIAAWRCGEGFF